MWLSRTATRRSMGAISVISFLPIHLVPRQIEQLLLASFHPSSPAYFGEPQNYFEQNWVWFWFSR